VLGGGDRVVVAGPMLGSVAPGKAPGLRVIDTVAGAVSAVIETDEPVQAVHVTSAGALLVSTMPLAEAPSGDIPTVRDGVLQVYDAETLTLRARLPIGAGALTVRSSADGTRAFVANLASGTVDVIDLDAMRVLRTDKIGEGAHGLAIVPAAG
jgi:DNA-binding beta-propeller fold protein YncE